MQVLQYFIFLSLDFKERSDMTVGTGTTGAKPIPIRALSRPNQFENTVYPLKVGVGVTDYYEKYFDIPYALPKQGII